MIKSKERKWTNVRLTGHVSFLVNIIRILAVGLTKSKTAVNRVPMDYYTLFRQ